MLNSVYLIDELVPKNDENFIFKVPEPILEISDAIVPYFRGAKYNKN